jgi:hypothetical protein
MRSGIITSGLIIDHVHLQKIVAGNKTWEMRKTKTLKRERIALIAKGTKAAYGVANIVDCTGPLPNEKLIESISLHGMTRDRIEAPDFSRRYAWVLSNCRALRHPVSCPMKPGQQIFVSISPETSRAIHEAL